MIKLDRELFNAMFSSGLFGYYCEDGAAIESNHFVLVTDKDNNKFLAHISEFEVDGFFVKLKDEK